MSQKPFLTAAWSDLILCSYAVPDEILAPYLPAGCELLRFGGTSYASIVAFNFTDARIMGCTPPFRGVSAFPELNLRFYVRQGDRRGVVFIREFVPIPLVARAARKFYNEPYQTAHGVSEIRQVDPNRSIRYDFIVEGRKQSVGVTTRKHAVVVQNGAKSQFFTEQTWGFGKNRRGKRIEYRVVHPPWRTYEIETFTLKIDFDLLYGPNWHFLENRKPDFMVCAEGSAVSVYRAQKG